MLEICAGSGIWSRNGTTIPLQKIVHGVQHNLKVYKAQSQAICCTILNDKLMITEAKPYFFILLSP